MTIVLDLLLIPKHAGIGASVASTIAYTTGGIAVALVFSRALRVPIKSLLPRRSDPRWVVTTLLRRWRPEGA